MIDIIWELASQKETFFSSNTLINSRHPVLRNINELSSDEINQLIIPQLREEIFWFCLFMRSHMDNRYSICLI